MSVLDEYLAATFPSPMARARARRSLTARVQYDYGIARRHDDLERRVAAGDLLVDVDERPERGTRKIVSATRNYLILNKTAFGYARWLCDRRAAGALEPLSRPRVKRSDTAIDALLEHGDRSIRIARSLGLHVPRTWGPGSPLSLTPFVP